VPVLPGRHALAMHAQRPWWGSPSLAPGLPSGLVVRQQMMSAVWAAEFEITRSFLSSRPAGACVGRGDLPYSPAMRRAIVSISVAALLTLSGRAAGASPDVPPKCSPADTQRHAILHSETFKAGGPWAGRYCGPGKAVVRVEGKSFTITGGFCTPGRVGFGLFANAGTKGIVLVLRASNRAGRTEIIDSSVRMPGVTGEIPNTGTAIRAKGLKSGTFTLTGSGALRVTGSWTCG
jgi:hypothetical protein